jgi:hypothetical protein
MAESAGEVRVAVDGVVRVAPLATAAPTSVDATWTGSTELGYISDEGITESNSLTTEDLHAWQRNAVVRTIVTEGVTTFQFTMIQTSSATLAEYYGIELADIDEATGSFVSNPGVEKPQKSYVLDFVDGDEKIRKYIPIGQITETGDISYVSQEIIAYPVTVTAQDSGTMGGSVKHFFSVLVDETP